MRIRNGLFVVAAATLALAGSIAIAQGERSDLDGVWTLTGTRSPDIALNDAGATYRADYDFMTDDPHMQCIPASVSRTMLTPSPLMEIRQHEDHIEFNHEMMDVKRRIPLDAELLAEDAPYSTDEHPHLGRSVARYEGENLVIESADIAEGIFMTLQWVGYPQSNLMMTTERYIPNGDSMQTRITHFDPVYYQTPFTIIYDYVRTDAPLLEWGCVPEKSCVDPRLCG